MLVPPPQEDKMLLQYYIAGIWVLLTLLPTLILNSKKEDKPLTRRDYAGWTLWAIGFLFEVIADHQKSRFRANPNNTVRITQLIITVGPRLE